MMKIVVLDGYAFNPGDLDWSPIAAQGEFTLYDRTDARDVVDRARDADVVLTNKVVLDAAVLARLPRLRYIGLLSTGCNAVDLAAAHRRGVVVTNVPGYSAPSVAQTTFALLLEAAVGVGLHARSVAQGEWTRSADFCYWKQPILELSGKTLGLIGFGSIARETAKIAQAFGMRVIACRRLRSDGEELGVRLATLDRVLSQSDAISLHCPLESANARMIDDAAIAQMKDGAIVINTARGGLVDEAAVAKALDRGKLGYYCADVLDVEPPRADCPLIGAPRCYLTPHIAWASIESRTRLMNIAADNLRNFIAGTPVNRVDAE